MAVYKIDEICSVIKGKTSIVNSSPGKYPLVTTAEHRLTADHFDFDAKVICVPMVSSTGHGHASLNRIHYQEGKFALASILAALILKNEDKILSEYLYIYLYIFKDSLLVTLMQGSANVSLTLASIKSIEIEAPTIEKQRTIIALYRKLEQRHTELSIKFRKQDELTKYFRHAIYSDAFSGRLIKNKKTNYKEGIFKDEYRDNIANSIKEEAFLSKWDLYKLKDICEIKMGQSPKGETYNSTGEGLPLINGPAEFGQNEFDNPFILKFTTDPIQIAEKNELLLCVRGSTTGRTNITNFDVCIGRGIASLKPKIADKYLFYFIHYSKDNILEMGTGLKFPSISKYQIENIVIPVPPISIQFEIISKVDTLIKSCNYLNLKFDDTKLQAEKLFRNILTTIFHKDSNKNKHSDIGIVFPFIDKTKKMQKQRISHNFQGTSKQFTLEELKSQFGNSLFSFEDILLKMGANYEASKDSIFRLLSSAEKKSKPFLSHLFDEKGSNKMLFKIIEKA
jgi:type I restriction enzyme S subunit